MSFILIVTFKDTKKGGLNVIDTNALRGKIIERGLTQAKMAEIIGITPKTFYEKMKRGVFGSDEIETMIQTLRIEKPMEIFFAKKVSL